MKTLAFLMNEMQSAKGLIRYAALLSKDLKARVHVLHVQYPQVYGSTGYMGTAVAPDPEHLQKTVHEVDGTVDKILQDLEVGQAGMPSIEFKSFIGDASVILEEKVEEGVYDMVMLQGSGEQDFWLQDSSIMGIVRNISCPVWIIPSDATYQPIKKIIYATDYKQEDIATLKSLIEMAKIFDSEILALHISNDDNFERKLKSEGFEEMLSEKIGYNKVSVKMIADKNGGDAVESLVSEAEKAKANLIVVLNENRNFFERLFKSSFTAQLIKEARMPILVFPKAN